MTSKAVNNLNAVVDASNQNVLSGAGAKQESSGILCISKHPRKKIIVITSSSSIRK